MALEIPIVCTFFFTIGAIHAIDQPRCVTFHEHILENISYSAYFNVHELPICSCADGCFEEKSWTPNGYIIFSFLYNSSRLFNFLEAPLLCIRTVIEMTIYIYLSLHIIKTLFLYITYHIAITWRYNWQVSSINLTQTVCIKSLDFISKNSSE